MHAVYIEQIFRIGEINFRSNMRILQGNLPKHIQIFADINLIGSSPLRLPDDVTEETVAEDVVTESETVAA